MLLKHILGRKVIWLATLFLITPLILTPTLIHAKSYTLPEQANIQEIVNKRNDKKIKEKAPKVIPSKPFDIREEKTKKQKDLNPELKLSQLLESTTSADTTPPIAPTQVTATASGLLQINASWNDAQDPESGISYYAFGIGTNSSGDYSSLANVRWWQVTYDKNISINLNLNPNLTYYVSVYAVNGAGLSSPFATSNPVHPVWTNLGQAGNVMQIQFAPTGYDSNGNPTAGWSADQIARMSDFFNKMYPILKNLYGPPATSYTVTIVRDLRYQGSNVFIPEDDEIRMADNFYPQLFAHELIHAFRNDFILSSNQNWQYDPTLSGFEEAFAQGVSYEAMNKYVETYPNDNIVPGNSLWGSSYDWNYDFQNVPELRGTDFWSDGGGTWLYWVRYETAAEAIRKINLESANFYSRFNQEYYNRINLNPMSVRSSKTLIVDIIKTLVPQIESMPAENWINKQNVFYSQNVYEEKIFHQIQDYPWNEFFSFQDLYFMKTMSCGSEWACWDGNQWIYHNLNGSTGRGNLTDVNGNTIWSGNLLIEPIQNPPDYYGFGSDKKSLTTASTLLPWPGGNTDDYIMNLTTLGLYKFESIFTNPYTGLETRNNIYRVMGSPIANNFQGAWGGILNHKNGTIYLNHEGFAEEPGIPVVNGAFAGSRSWTGIYNPRTGGRDSVPGKVFIRFVDSDTGTTYLTQRNIDYGNANGSQMFLLEFTEPIDATPPLVSITSPANNTSISGIVNITANATDNVGISKVEFYLDGVLLSTSTSSPYSASWDTNTATLGAHTLTAKAYDSSGNSTVSSPVLITIVDTTTPTVAITNPANNSIVSVGKTTVISATATDNRSVAKVEFYVNNVLTCTDSGTPYTCNWPVPKKRNIKYTLKAKVYDSSNNTAEAISTVTSK